MMITCKVVVYYLLDDLWYAFVYSVDCDVFIPDDVLLYFLKPKLRNGMHAPETIVKDCPYWTCITKQEQSNHILVQLIPIY